MSIADKLTAVAENQQKVYDAGYEKGKAEGGGRDYLRLCNLPCFPGLGVFDEEEVTLNFDVAYELDRMIYSDYGEPSYQNSMVKHLTLNFAQPLLSSRQMFTPSGGDNVLEHLTLNADLSQSKNALRMFCNGYALRVIDGTPINLSSATQVEYFLYYCPVIEEIRFAPGTVKAAMNVSTSPRLSDTTVQSIIDGLADLTGGTAQTLTFHATVGAKLTDAQKATISGKNWTLVY